MVNSVMDVPVVFTNTVEAQALVETLLPDGSLGGLGQRVAVLGYQRAGVFLQVFATGLDVGAELGEVELRAPAHKDDADAAIRAQHRVQRPSFQALLELLARDEERRLCEQQVNALLPHIRGRQTSACRPVAG